MTKSALLKMVTNMNLNLYLLLLFFMQLGIVASAPVQKVITNHCDGQDCEINIQYHDATQDLSFQTSSNDSVISALLDITIPRDDNSNRNDLVIVMENVVQMLSSIMQTRDNYQQLANIFQQFDMESRPSLTPELLDFLQTSPQPEIVVTTPEPEIATTQAPIEDCSNAPSTGQYSISPINGGTNPILVVCDMDTTSGGWIVIQRRFDGSVDFDRNWVDYENGFGTLDGEFWLGLSKMHTITSHGTWKVRFELEDFDGNIAYAEYGFFQVGDSASNYQLTIRSYSGDAGDGMMGHNLNGMAFTTKDRDNDEHSGVNCGINNIAGWWHRACSYVGVTGLYLGQGVTDHTGMSWHSWKNSYEVLKKTEMKIKRID